MENKIVLGWVFGDEGKGTTTQWLVKKAIDEGKTVRVCRFSGGPQAAHTIKKDDITHICSSFGSGVLYGVDTEYIDGYFDPICFVNECIELERKNIKIPDIYLSSRVKFITPYDVMVNQMSNREKSDGTCGKGIFRTFERCKHDLFKNPMYNEVLGYEFFIEQVEKHYQMYDEDCHYMFINACDSDYFKTHVHIIDELEEVDVRIFEGTQGLLLDMDCGFYPNVTPSNTGLKKLNEFLNSDTEVYLVTRSYLTRHGNGYVPLKPFAPINPYETNVNNMWQGNFKTGEFELPLLEKAIQRHCLDNYQKKYGVKFNAVFTCNDIVDMKEKYEDILSDLNLNFNDVYASYNPYSDFETWRRKT